MTTPLSRRTEVEVRIAADGRVELRVKGEPGSSCEDVAAGFEALGDVISSERTAEFYDVDASASVETRRGR